MSNILSILYAIKDDGCKKSSLNVSEDKYEFLYLNDTEFAANYWIGHSWHSPFLNEAIHHLKDGKPASYACWRAERRCTEEDEPNCPAPKTGVYNSDTKSIHYHTVSGREIILTREGIYIERMKDASHKASWDIDQSNEWEDYEIEMLASQKYSY